MTSTRFLVAVIVFAGCSDSSSAPDRLLPGPCSASYVVDTDLVDPPEIEIVATYSYDAGDHLVRVERPTVEAGGATYTGMIAEYERDGDGELVSIGVDTTPDAFEYMTTTWSFDGDAVSYSYHYSDFTDAQAQHEAGLRFVGDPFELGAVMDPSSPDSIVQSTYRDIDSDVTTETSYTYDGPAHQGTRTRTSSTGAVRTFSYDGDGNLLEDSAAASTTTYRWETGRLAEVTRDAPEYHELYTRDEFGNLLEVTSESSETRVVTYDYGCW